MGQQQMSIDELTALYLKLNDQPCLVLDCHNTIVATNALGAQFFGFKNENIVGQSIFDLLVNPDTFALFLQEQQQQKIAQQSDWLVFEGMRAGGWEFNFEARLIRLRDDDSNLFVMLNDLSNHLARSRDLEVREKIYSAITEASLDTLITINLKDEIIDFSLSGEQMLGWKRSEVIGQTLNELIIPEPMREMHKKGMAHFRATGEGPLIGKRVEIEALHRDGHLIPVELALIVIEHNGERLVTAFMRDISERKQSEAELVRAKETAEAASQAKSRFLSYMSHEIRTPLNALLGALTLLSDRLTTNDQHRLFNTASSSGQNLLSIINEILDFSKIESGHIVCELSSVDLDELTYQVLDVAANKKKYSEVDVFCHITPNVPSVLQLDKMKLSQVLTILLDNAIKFTRKGRLLLEVDYRCVEQENRLELKVSDTGCGIEASRLESIFSEYEQADPMRDTGFGGTGLGLAIARKLLIVQNGEITVHSEPGVGTTFSIFIPVDKQKQVQWKTPTLNAEKTHFRLISNNAELFNFFNLSLGSYWPNALVETVTFSDLPLFEMNELQSSNWIIDDQIEHAKSITDYFDELGISYFVLTDDYDKPVENTNSQSQYVFRPLHSRSLLKQLAQVKAHCIPIEKTPNLSSRSGHLLLVDDVAINLEIAKEMLENLGYTITTANNGREAIDLCQHQSFDLILMDMRMPVMNGIDATIAIRTHANPNQYAPIIALTANAESSEIERCRIAGTNSFISKPFQLPQLVNTIEELIAKEPTGKNNLTHSEEKDVASENHITPSKSNDDNQQKLSSLIDYSVLERLAQDTSIELLPQMLAMFCKETSKRYNLLEQAIFERRTSEIAEQAHAIKSCSGTFGATLLYEEAQQVEQAARYEKKSIDDLMQPSKNLLETVLLTQKTYESFDIKKISI